MIVPKDKKPEAPPPSITIEVDERWMGEWVKLGLKEIGKSLANHAAFDEYYKHREHA
jgi:hypothetical protein